MSPVAGMTGCAVAVGRGVGCGGVLVGAAVGVTAALSVHLPGAAVAVGTGVAVGAAVAVGAGVAVGVAVGAAVGVAVGAGRGSAAPQRSQV